MATLIFIAFKNLCIMHGHVCVMYPASVAEQAVTFAETWKSVFPHNSVSKFEKYRTSEADNMSIRDDDDKSLLLRRVLKIFSHFF